VNNIGSLLDPAEDSQDRSLELMRREMFARRSIPPSSVIAGLLLLATAQSSRADVAGPATLVCKGESQHQKKSAESRKAVEGGRFYKFAVKNFGAPTSCEATFDKFEDQLFTTLVYNFAGATFSSASMPPETSITGLKTTSGVLDEQSARAMLQDEIKEEGWSANWSKPDESQDDKSGLITKTFWSGGDGDNMGVDLVYRGQKLVGIAIHMAL